MKKHLTLLLLILAIHFCQGQEIHITDNIAYVNNKAYVKLEKKSKRKYFVYDVKTHEKLLKVKVSSIYNERYNRYDYNTSMYFYPIKKNLAFRDVVIKDETSLVQFLHDEGMFLSHKTLSTKTLLEEYKRLSARAKCDNILKNDFSQVINDHFVSIVNKDTLIINEIKYRCVYSAFYTKKAMYDRFGRWNKAVFPYKGAQSPNLIWNNIQLLDDVDKKFTVIARGLESRQTIYASMMILDENGRDMLAEKAPYRFRLTELFGHYIKNNSRNEHFYEAYWTTFNPERWKKIQEYKRSKNSVRATSPFFQEPTKTRTFVKHQ
ncbi:hypothetical protein [Kordia sp.]|uniref:hypothetical protein n=1 Tax=Kordia sp. TaxID=1965332 RepID=UPI0025C26E72|nr:hypothetical protein [Kordia sp.]MCH2194089.1 hypothetical protein [Kordia sp.]